MNQHVRFTLEPGEDVLLQSSVKLRSPANKGTLTLTTQRLVFCRTSSFDPLISIPFTNLSKYLVNKVGPKSKQIMLKVLTFEDEQNQKLENETLQNEAQNELGNEKKKKRNASRRKRGHGSVFEFSTPSAAEERDGFKDLIAQLVPLARIKQEKQKLKQEKKKREELFRNVKDEPSDDPPLHPYPSTSYVLEPSQKRRKLSPVKEEKDTKEDIKTHYKTSSIKKKDEVSIKEAKQRAALLAGNEELNALYSKLVLSHVITDSEFWATRKHLLENEAMKSTNQRKGMPTELVADVRPSMETCNAVHYRLTPTIIHQIFLEYPAVKRAYDAWVPDKLNEKQFWTKYFQSQYFHRDRLNSKVESANEDSGVSPDDVFANCSTEDEQLVEDEDTLQKKLKSVCNITSNLTLEPSEPFVDEKPHISEGEISKEVPSSLSLVRRFNRHGALVLGTDKIPNSEAGASDEHLTTKQKILEKVSYSDLEEKPSEGNIVLNIQENRRYFEGHASNVCSLSKAQAEKLWDSYANEVKSWAEKVNLVTSHSNDHPSVPLINVHELDSSTHLRIMKDLVRQHNLKNMIVDPRTKKQTEQFALSQEQKTKLYEYYARANELLRHFWASYPITSRALASKVSRITESINSLYEELQRERRDYTSELGKLLLPIIQSLDKALEMKQSKKSFL